MPTKDNKPSQVKPDERPVDKSSEQKLQEKAPAPPKVKLYSGPIHCEGISTRGHHIEIDLDLQPPMTEDGVKNSFMNQYNDAIRDSITFREISAEEYNRIAHEDLDKRLEDVDAQRQVDKGIAVDYAKRVERNRAEGEPGKEAARP